MIQVEIKHPSDSLLEFVRHLQLENRRKIEELKNEVMRNDEILEGNKLIAEFMGYELNKYDYYLFPGLLPQFRGSDHAEWCSTQEIQIDWDNLKDIELYEKTGGYYWEISSNHLCYESSWNWLMPVVEKIQRIVIKDGHEVCIEFYEGLPNIKETYVTIDENIEVSHPDSKIAIWMAIVQFIKYQNVKES